MKNQELKCPECGKLIEKVAESCPFCKKKIPGISKKEGIVCKNCGRLIAPKKIDKLKKITTERIVNCPYCQRTFKYGP